jgi:small-conductance mechanosensitive channel
LFAETFDRGAKASFDVRGATIAGGLGAVGVQAGEANKKGGYKARKEASEKAHKEYAESLNKAFDEKGNSKREDEKISVAERAYDAAKEAHKKLVAEDKENKEVAQAQVAQHQEEVDRLQDLQSRFGSDSTRDALLATARQNLATSTARLTAANPKLDASKMVLEKLATAEKAVQDAAKDKISEEKKRTQLAYAENIKGPLFGSSVPGWVVYGPGAPAAAKKIIKDAKAVETEEEKLIKQLKKMLKKDEKDKNGGATPHATPATPPPAPPVAPPHP